MDWHLLIDILTPFLAAVAGSLGAIRNFVGRVESLEKTSAVHAQVLRNAGLIR